jgi:drug/metabolite transporter (DMT)-like permease
MDLSFPKGGSSTIILTIIVIVACETIAQSCLKQSEKQSVYFFIAMVLYGVICYLLYICYTYRGKLGQVNLLWSSFSIISVILAGYFLYGESINGNRIMAIIFAVAAIYFANE